MKLNGHKQEKSGEKGQSNDPWRREELILALELYFDCDPFKILASDDKVLALSKVLNSLPFNRAKRDNSLFRNPNGVKMKLLNFIRLDPKYESKGKGLSKGSKLEVAVWDEYAGNRASLKKMSELIRQSIEADLPEDDNEDELYFEGQLLKRMHLSRERNRKVILKAKARALKHGPLTCEVCKFTYVRRYGSIGENFIEAHHTVPISEYLERRETKVEDIVLLCANCHRMIHKRRPWLTIKELKALLLDDRKEAPNAR